jgi:hypothetical protein
MGNLCMEGISWRTNPSEGSPRDYVFVLSIGSELYRARSGNPLVELARFFIWFDGTTAG